ncbi:MAG TPA: mannosyltransferase family protein [Rubrobacter sp.]|nr:mannosyltransferase family protein [Rubrobacter sp.]
MDRESRKSTGVAFVLAVYAASRLFYLISGSLLAYLVPTSSFQRATLDVPSGSMNIWSHWDGEHYVRLAMGGYLHPPDNVSPAFFPLYPLLLRSFAELFGGPITKEALSVWAPLLSLLFLPFALYFIYRIALDAFDERVAKGTVLILAFFPTTFFLNAAYTESMFLALSAGSLWAMRVRKDLLVACVLAGFAAATRNVGVFLVAPLIYEWIKDIERFRWRGIYLLLAPGGLFAYMGYLWVRFGDPLLFYSAQESWGRQATGPLDTASRAWGAAVEGSGRLLDSDLWAHPSLSNAANQLAGASNFFNLVFFVFATIVLLAGLRYLPLSLSVYGLLLVAPATLFGTSGSPLMGTPRYVLVAFPVFIVLALLFRNRVLLDGWLVVSTILSLALCGLFVSWRFVA